MSGEFEGFSCCAVVGTCGNLADEFNELKAEKGEVQGTVFVQKLHEISACVL